jgi:hypothetical protein
MVYGVAYESYGIEAFVGLIKVSRVTAVKIRLLLVEELQLSSSTLEIYLNRSIKALKPVSSSNFKCLIQS